jgi:osmotically-inducible protein OsmY
MNHGFHNKKTTLRTACIITMLAVPLAACSDRPAEPEGADQDVQQMVRDKEAERRPGSGDEPAVTANGADYTDEYSEPRESWTGDNAARDMAVTDIAESDAKAQRLLADALNGRDGFGSLEIEVQDGVAVLRGEVESAVQRRQAETMALAMEEIVAVRNELEISSGPE